jgi:hypothetical protein
MVEIYAVNVFTTCVHSDNRWMDNMRMTTCWNKLECISTIQKRSFDSLLLLGNISLFRMVEINPGSVPRCGNAGNRCTTGVATCYEKLTECI